MNTTDEIILEALLGEIEAERDWRVADLIKVKLILRELDLRNDEKLDTFIRMTIPIIYAHWEGFIKISIKYVINYINNQNLNSNEVKTCILTYANNITYDRLKGKHSFEQKCEFTELFLEKLNVKVTLSNKVDTKSNLKCEVLYTIFKTIGLEYTLGADDVVLINKLVDTRNSIAHGQNSIIVDKTQIDKYISNMTRIFDDVIVELYKYVTDKKYLK